MDRPSSLMTPGIDDFFADLPVLAQASATFDASAYRAAPDDWELVVTDIVSSTQAVAGGKHKTVNFVAAMAIAALKNLCAPTRLPFLFPCCASTAARCGSAGSNPHRAIVLVCSREVVSGCSKLRSGGAAMPT